MKLIDTQKAKYISVSLLFFLILVSELSFAWAIHPICKKFQTPENTAFLFGKRLGFLHGSNVARESTFVENIAIQNMSDGVNVHVDLVQFGTNESEITSVITVRKIAPYDPDSRRCNVTEVRVFIDSQEFDQTSLF